MLNRPTNFALITLLVVFLASCSDSPTIKPGSSKPRAAAQTDSQADIKASTLRNLLEKAQQQNSPERENLLLQAAEIYLEQGELDKAYALVNKMSPAKLPDPVFITYSRITALLELAKDKPDAARGILTNPRLERHLNALEPQQEANLREVRAQAFERTNQLEEAVSERISLSALLANNKANSTNQEALWRTLMNISLADLETNASQGAGGITQGWYSLAAISKNNTLSIETQQAQLNKWLSRWPTHPANGNLPKELGLLQKLVKQQPQKIALLLPLKGRLAEAGEAVSDGFFAAYYQSFNDTHQAPQVRQYDTSGGATTAYQQAVAEGADLVIGPLDKEDVNQFGQFKELPVPLLTLNYLSIDTQPTNQPADVIPGLYQFGLAVEDEARQAARKGIQDGLRHALVVATKQEWSERIAQAFNEEWVKLGGAIVGESLFITQDQFSDSVRNAFSIDESQARMNLLKQQLATKFEFTPRRRADIDMIFMAVTPSQGRQIKPTFAYYFANNIPTYATSNIYSGNIDAANNEDLNDVIFNTLPWVFDENNPEKIALAQNTKSSAVYSRLHALGADAFHLYPRLSQLKLAPQMRIYGATGSLHLLVDGRIEREQIWARFNNGLAEPIATVINENDLPQDN
ncbi:MAG: penicillin-binding protein activator [Pseudomonadota bacterium]